MQSNDKENCKNLQNNIAKNTQEVDLKQKEKLLKNGLKLNMLENKEN